MYQRLLPLALAAAMLGGCATKRDLRDLRTEMQESRAAQAEMLREIQRQNQTILDSLRIRDVRLRGDVSNQLVQIERQLVQIQELTGQGQQTLSGLRQELREREAALRAALASAGTQPTDGGAGAPAAGDPDELFAAARGALDRGSFSTARTGFEEFVRSFPQHARAAEAQLGVGESYEKAKDPQKAIDAYQRVLELYPNSPRAPTALYRAALVEVGRGNQARARTMLNQLLTAYPRSPEAAQARTQLQKLRAS